jgi:hypothetical protein
MTGKAQKRSPKNTKIYRIDRRKSLRRNGGGFYFFEKFLKKSQKGAERGFENFFENGLLPPSGLNRAGTEENPIKPNSGTPSIRLNRTAQGAAVARFGGLYGVGDMQVG